MPQTVRKGIIRAFCPPRLKRETLANPQHRDCLIRLYLGRRDSGKRETESSLSLRNFPSSVNDMEDLHLDVEHFAQVMADALAVLHWRANVDGNDVEFVLGRSPTYLMAPSSNEIEKADKESDIFCGLYPQKHGISTWLLDFNMCKEFNVQDPRTLELLTKAFWFNDPYYPRPVSTDEADVRLWKVFAARYLATSSRLTDSQIPCKFIRAVEAERLVRQERIAKQGKNSLFSALAG